MPTSDRQIVHENDVRDLVRVYRTRMHRRVQPADLTAVLILLVFVGALGTGLGLAAAHVRSGGQAHRGPLKIILRGSNETPSIQRDRVRLNRNP